MLLTPLFVQALNWSQWITDHIFRYRYFVYWDWRTNRFELETRRHHKWPWLFANFVVLAGLSIPLCIMLFARCWTHLKEANALEVVMTSCLMCTVMVVVLTAAAYVRWGSDISSGKNHLIILEARLSMRYGSKPQIRPLKAIVIGGKKYAFSKSWQQNGNPDIPGILASVCVPAMTVAAALAPWLAMWLRQDPVYLAFRNYLKSLKFWGTLAFQAIRVIGTVWSAVEISNCFRMMAVGTLIAFQGLYSCQSLLITQPSGESVVMEFRQLAVCFAKEWDIIAFSMSMYFAVMYVIILGCVTALVTAYMELTAQVIVMGCLISLTTAVIMITILFLVVSVDQQSTELHLRWIRSCAQARSNLFQTRMLRKLLISMKPLRVPYGEL